MEHNFDVEKAKETSCMFTGHRILPKYEALENLEMAVRRSIEEAYEKGYRTFYSGGAMGFDLLCAISVINLKKKCFPDISLIMALPCYNHYGKWARKDQLLLARLLEEASETVFVSGEYERGCMQKRNRYMADLVSHCICYLTKDTGGTAYTVKYARKKGVSIQNLGDSSQF